MPGAALVWVFLLSFTPLSAADVWWHLKAGELILETGQVPRFDWFTYTSRERPWIDLHWLFQLLAFGLQRLGGTQLLVLAKAAAVTATVAIGMSVAGRRLPPAAVAACWVLPAVCISARGLLRPELVSFLLLATTLVLLERAERSPRVLWALLPLQLVWVNSHGLFVLGLVVWAAALLDRLARETLDGRWGVAPAPTSPPRRQLVVAAGLVAAAAFVNPYFVDGALFPLTLYRKFGAERELYASVQEFRPLLDYLRNGALSGHAYVVASLALWLATAASFAWLARERRVAVGRLVLFAAFSLLAWQAFRNIGIFGVVAGILLTANAADALERRRTRRRLPASTSRVPAVAVLVVFVALSVSVVGGQWATWWGYGRTFGWGEKTDHYAHAAARFAGQPGLPTRAFASDFGVAAVYLHHNFPERQVFIDGRLEVASPETLLAYLKARWAMIEGLPEVWQEILGRDASGAYPSILLDRRYHRREIAGLADTPGWRAVFADRKAVVFVEDELAQRLDLPPASAAEAGAPESG